MIDTQNKAYVPTLVEISEYVHNPVFSQFCGEMK